MTIFSQALQGCPQALQGCPPIILNKIYWYRWRHLLNNVCAEYRQNYQLNNDVLRFVKIPNFSVNSRILYDNWFHNYEPIYSFRGSKWSLTNASLPIYYFYSNGSNYNKYIW